MEDTLLQIKEQTFLIGKSVSEKYDYNNPEKVSEKLIELIALQAMSSHTVASSDKLVKKKENEGIDNIMSNPKLKDISITIFKKKVDAYAMEEAYFKLLADKLHSSLGNSIGALRSQLSKLKEEFIQAKYHGNVQNDNT
jgi:hypothetical protein